MGGDNRQAGRIQAEADARGFAVTVVVDVVKADDWGMIGRLHHLAIDCPDPAVLAEFYSAVLGKPITYLSDDWVVVSDDDHSSGLAFQLAPDHQRPLWPDPARPQQMHLDIMVDDLVNAESEVLAVGARKLADHVYEDPAGHPFCLIPKPSWANTFG